MIDVDAVAGWVLVVLFMLMVVLIVWFHWGDLSDYFNGYLL